MGVLLDLFMLCTLCMVNVSSTKDVFFYMKPYGVKMCNEISRKYAGKMEVVYKEDKLECLITDIRSTFRQPRKRIALETHRKLNVSVPLGTRQRSKESARHIQQKRNQILKEIHISSNSTKLDSYEVLSMTGSISFRSILYILLREKHYQDRSYYITTFRFFNDSSWTTANVPSLKVKCFDSEKRVYQIFKGGQKVDVIGLVISGDIFEISLYGDPFMSKFKAVSLPLTTNKWNGSTFCFFWGGISCIQEDTMLMIAIDQDISAAERQPLPRNFPDMTDLAYCILHDDLIIVMREKLVVAKFSRIDYSILVKESFPTTELKVTWLQFSLVFHLRGPLGKFKTCEWYNECTFPSDRGGHLVSMNL